MPILGSLHMLADLQKDAHFASQLNDVKNGGEAGEALSAASRRRRSGNSSTTLLAGERSGNLLEVLEHVVQRVSLTFTQKASA